MKPPPLPAMMTTTDSFEDRKVVQYLGVVSGFSAKNLGVRGGFQLAMERREFGNYSSLVAETQEAAMKDLLQRAQERGADAVVGTQVDFEILEGFCLASCYGTAVRLENE
ncbi:MAG: YbjQ family protein [Roseibacillus sp.]